MREKFEWGCTFVKIQFRVDQELEKGLAFVLPELGVEASAEADLVITGVKADKDILKMTRKGNTITITYGGGKTRFFRGLATVVGWLKTGKDNCEKEEKPIFRTNGAMVDMSRNAVMNVQTVKFMMRKMALMGQNMFMLYTEDTYEVPERPYFGHLRGRYTKEQIRELDAYALDLGIELIPCIQVLGHLATALKWPVTTPYRDTVRALLVDAPETYALIEDMLKSISESFTTKRIHIGLDETHDLGTGQYLDKYGYTPREEIYFKHLAKIKVLLDKYGFRPMMWSDMFFRLAGKNLENYRDYDPRVELPENIREKTQGIQQVFWDYYNPDENFYRVNMEKHKQLGEDTVFAGGVWGWSSFCILYSYSLKMTVPALDAAKKAGIRHVIATVWHNGSEASLLLSLAGLAWYADYEYRGCYDAESVKECFYNATGFAYDDFMALEELEKPEEKSLAASRIFAYNDPLIGKMDAYLGKVDAKAYYGPLTEKLKKLSVDKGEFTEAFEVIEKLSSLFELKADFGLRLRNAYLADDREQLAEIANSCDEIILRIRAHRQAHRKAWMKYNSPFGWEIHDIRSGAMLCRIDTAKERILAYLRGEIDAIEEVDAERLPLRPGDPEEMGGHLIWYGFGDCITANIL